jgi:DNA-directed RNA polymerase subunit omega
MLYPPMSVLLNRINSRYLLVNVAAQRARKIAQEAGEKGEMLDRKPVSIAIEEIARGAYTAHIKHFF